MLIGEEDDFYLGDFIEDYDVISLVDYVVYEMMKKQFENVLDILIDWEENVLCLCFGLDDGWMWILEEVGCVFGVIWEWIW